MSSQLWDRQRDDAGNLEPILWYGRFRVFLEMGTERDLLGAVNKVHKSVQRRTSVPGAWFNNARKWNWHTRAESYDLHEMNRRETEYKQACDAWAAERFKFADTGRQKLDTLMTFPVTKQTRVSDDGNTYIIEPLSVKEIKDIAQAYKILDELARTTTRETLPVTKVAPTTPDGKESYDPAASIKSEILSALSSIATASAENDDS